MDSKDLLFETEHLEVVTYIRGKIAFNKDDFHIGKVIRTYGELNEGQYDLFRQIIRPGWTVVDAGANIGYFTLAFSQLVGEKGNVVAFEPVSYVNRLLSMNIAINELDNVVCHRAAVGKTPGTIQVPCFSHNRESFNATLVRENDGNVSGYEEAPVRSIDSLNLKRCDFIKIDVEGMENDVVLGAARTILEFRPILYVEAIDAKANEIVLETIRKIGYKAYWHMTLFARRDNFRKAPVDFYKQIASLDWLCVPSDTKYNLVGMEEVSYCDPMAAMKAHNDRTLQAHALKVDP